MQKSLYLVLSRSNSLPGLLIRAITRDDINHCALSPDDSLTQMQSFGRTRVWNPLSGGLTREDKCGAFYRRFRGTYIRLYRLSVSEEIYSRVIDRLDADYARRREFRYNFFGCFTAQFRRSVVRTDRYFCSEYVAEVLTQCGVCALPFSIHTCRPNDFEALAGKELVYEGLLRKYVPDNAHIK